jgi:hypothetical protein
MELEQLPMPRLAMRRFSMWLWLLTALLPLLEALLEAFANLGNVNKLSPSDRALLCRTLKKVSKVGPAASAFGLPLDSPEVQNAPD